MDYSVVARTHNTAALRELPAGISLDSLKRQHPSRPRNLLIADVCFKGGYIDAWGSGTLKIISTCKEAGLPAPEIIEQDGEASMN